MKICEQVFTPKTFNIEVESMEHSKLIQDLLFKAGNAWAVSGKKYSHVDKTRITVSHGLIYYGKINPPSPMSIGYNKPYLTYEDLKRVLLLTEKVY